MSDVSVTAGKSNTGVKLLIDYGPLALFLLAYNKPALFRAVLPPSLYIGDRPEMFIATSVLMIATAVALAASYFVFRRTPVMLWVTAIMVGLFGGLTLFLHDAKFIKIKVTIIYLLFSGFLLGGLGFGKVLLPVLFDGALNLDVAGWRKLTLRWGLFFLTLALLNEVIWRDHFTKNYWIYFKFPGVPILIFLFMMTQVPLLMKHELKEDEA
ncbi:inner membrane-spanning protein YciB [Methylovirgula sp. 4M-Z18]|uniref:inner membrane-spanning protein YciB n=1 Tax=Methylovirgula sp. 4M-Z18 TaxID=2293567 RepID=UPI000E2E76F4|nr:septation protein IspZ [Methylovirgula sp. 4M-Z18]RFB79117.1 septation protein A [Methylovirgula sp. 4M-Z18]